MGDALEIRRLGVALGAEIEGLDLRRQLTDGVAQLLREGLDEHQVLFLRNQHLNADEQIAVGAVFGEPRGAEPFVTLGGYPEFSATAMSLARNEEIPPDTENWHADVTYIPDPPVAAVLCPQVLPAVGGDTVWVSMYSIYESLSPPLQQLCAGLSGIHTWEAIRPLLERLGQEVVDKIGEIFPPRVQPLVQTHPRTGRTYLYYGGRRGWMNEIQGLHPEEGELLLDYLRRKLENVEYQIRWRWSEGDVAIWDERTTNHKGMSDHYRIDPHRIVRSVWVYPAAAATA